MSEFEFSVHTGDQFHHLSTCETQFDKGMNALGTAGQ
jgi:hypothetical protein